MGHHDHHDEHGWRALTAQEIEAITRRAGCDVHSYDLRAGGAERPVDGLSTRAYSETAPTLNEGVWSFVRRGGGPRKGVYVMTRKRPTRISPTLARDTANNGTRVAYAYNSSRGGG